MSSATMLEILRRDWEYPKRRGLILRDCQVTRVYPRDGKDFVLEYEMHFLDEKRERVERVFGELVGEQAQKQYGEVIKQLKKTRGKQLSWTAPIDHITCLPHLGLILRFSGLDEKLPGLRHTRSRSVIRLFASQYLSLDGGEVTKCSIDILGHRLGKRCVIRYRLKSLDPKTGRRVRHSRRSLIGKVYKFREDRGRQVFAAMQGLWEQGFSDGADDGIRIPKPLAYLPDWQLLLMEDAPGASLVSLEGSRIEPAVEAAGRVLAKLHRCPLEVPGRHTVEDELELLMGWVAVVSQVHPGLKTALVNALKKVQVALDRCRSFEPTLVHRDFYEKQVLVDNSQTILIDFDTLCLSDPAIDVGNFLAHVRLAGLQRLGNIERLEEAFLDAYGPAPSRDFPNRVEAYTRSSLLRLACLYSLWPQWSHLAEPLLGDLTRAKAVPGGFQLSPASDCTQPSHCHERFEGRKLEGEMKMFIRDDGRTLRVVNGFREQVLFYRPSFTPKPNWSDEDYSAAADKKLQRGQKRLSEFSRSGVALDGAQVLELGCGAGIDCLLTGLQPVRQVVGIDLQLSLFEPSEKGERTRRMTRKVLDKLNVGGNIGEVLHRLPVRFATMDARRMPFPDDTFDFLWSRSAMEHIIPLDKALTEIARVVRPGGLIYYSIDPYFWLRGCHKTGLVDIPWAHARLLPEEFRRFVTESEGEAKAIKRCERLKTLNQFTLRQWRKIIEAGPFEILEWKEERSAFAEKLLEEHPEVEDSLLEGVERRDLIHGRIKVWLRNKGQGAE